MENFMTFYDELFLSDSIRIEKEELIKAIISGKTFLHTYIITLPLIDSENQLEIYHIELNKQDFFRAEDFIVLGVALGYCEAIELVEKITNLVYIETGDANIKEYFRDKI